MREEARLTSIKKAENWIKTHGMSELWVVYAGSWRYPEDLQYLPARVLNMRTVLRDEDSSDPVNSPITTIEFLTTRRTSVLGYYLEMLTPELLNVMRAQAILDKLSEFSHEE